MEKNSEINLAKCETTLGWDLCVVFADEEVGTSGGCSQGSTLTKKLKWMPTAKCLQMFQQCR